MNAVVLRTCLLLVMSLIQEALLEAIAAVPGDPRYYDIMIHGWGEWRYDSWLDRWKLLRARRREL